MAPTGSTSDPRSGWSSSLRPPLNLQPAVLPEDDDDDDDRAVAELLNSALEGDLSRIKKLVTELSKAGKGVNEVVAAAAVGEMGTKRRGPLHMAAANGNAEMCRFLINTCDVDVDAIDSDGFYEVAELLLSREAEVDLMCENGGAPIHIAAENGHAKMLKLLLQHKADYNAGNPATVLVIAAGKGLTDCIKCLLRAGADANIPDKDGKLPVQMAACQGLKECIEILFPVTTPLADYATRSIDGIIQHEKTVNSQQDGKLPVQIAACQGLKQCVEILFPVTTPLAEYATWSIDGIIQHEKTASSEQVSDLDDKENSVSDDNTNKDTQPHQSKSCSEKGEALATVDENGGGTETLLSGLKIIGSAKKTKVCRGGLLDVLEETFDKVVEDQGLASRGLLLKSHLLRSGGWVPNPQTQISKVGAHPTLRL